MGVGLQFTRAALDFDEEEPFRTQHEEVHLVDAPVCRDELEVRPGAPGLLVRQALADELQRVAFPRELRLGDDMPAKGRHRHGGIPAFRAAIRREVYVRQALGRKSRARLQLASVLASFWQVGGKRTGDPD